MVLRAPSLCSPGAVLPNTCCGGICFAVVWITPMGLRSGEVSAVEVTVWRSWNTCVREGSDLGEEETCGVGGIVC